MFSRTPSVDGYGDRQDIADARDFSDAARMAEYQAMLMTQSENAIDQAMTEWGTDWDAVPLTHIIADMLVKECYEKLILKSQVFWDVESVNEALIEACIVLGLDSEEYCASWTNNGCNINLRLV